MTATNSRTLLRDSRLPVETASATRCADNAMQRGNRIMQILFAFTCRFLGVEFSLGSCQPTRICSTLSGTFSSDVLRMLGEWVSKLHNHIDNF
jgi:hypothetical protein